MDILRIFVMKIIFKKYDEKISPQSWRYDDISFTALLGCGRVNRREAGRTDGKGARQRAFDRQGTRRIAFDAPPYLPVRAEIWWSFTAATVKQGCPAGRQHIYR